MTRKSEVPIHLKSLLKILKSKGKQVKYIICDNAGEHESLKKYCEENGIVFEMIAPYTPQHNVIERRDLNCIKSMLYRANFTEEMASKLWGIAGLYLQHIRNMTSTMANSDKLSPNTKFDNENNIEIERMQPFG